MNMTIANRIFDRFACRIIHRSTFEFQHEGRRTYLRVDIFIHGESSLYQTARGITQLIWLHPNEKMMTKINCVRTSRNGAKQID